MKVRIIYIIGAVLLMLGGSYWLGHRKASLETDRVAIALLRAQDTISVYTVKIHGLGQTVYETSSVLLLQKEAIKLGLLEEQRLRKLNVGHIRTHTRLKGQIQVLRDSLQHSNVIHYDTVLVDSDMTGYIEIPASFAFQDNYLDLGVEVSETWCFDLNLDVPLEITVTDLKSVVTTPNPYVSFQEIKTIVTPPEVKWHDQPWVRWTERILLFGGGVWVGSK